MKSNTITTNIVNITVLAFVSFLGLSNSYADDLCRDILANGIVDERKVHAHSEQYNNTKKLVCSYAAKNFSSDSGGSVEYTDSAKKIFGSFFKKKRPARS